MPASAAIEESTVLSVVRRSLSSSRLYGRLRTAVAHFEVFASNTETWLRSSRLVTAVPSPHRSVAGLERSSKTRAVARQLLRWVRASFLYRWLTAEPEPEVIVIDLRETWVVGPIIAILDWTIERLGVAYRNWVGERVIRNIQQRLHRAPIRYISVGLLAILLPAVVVFTARTGLSATTLLLVAAIILSATGTLIDTSWPEVYQSWPVQLLIAALEPPEPPERNS